MRKIIILSTIFLLANCNKKSETQNPTKVNLQEEKQLSKEELDKEVTRIVDSAANAAEYGTNEKVYDENLKVKEAKNILDEANGYVKKGILKQMNTADVNKKINPLMKKYEKILSELNTSEQNEVKNYRIEQLNKVIDLQVENNK